MNSTVRAYSTSTVTAAPLVLAAGVLAVAWSACVPLLGRVWPVLAVVTVAVLAAGVHLTSVRLTVGAGQLFVGLGPWGRTGRRIPLTAVRDVEPVRLSGAQAYGFGLRWARAGLSRYTVRPGHTVHLVLTSGEQVYVSVRDAAAATAALAERPAVTDGPVDVPRPWFGPKRIGFGLRPQTWQGWLITVIPVVLVVGAVLLARR